tara:strand:- start:21 stop:281 length:261 start_codon:yes stop_codon:yes gene_type:complete
MLCETFGKKVGLRLWGALQMLLHLGFGWPAYLLIGATGGPGRGGTNHFMVSERGKRASLVEDEPASEAKRSEAKQSEQPTKRASRK